MKIFIINSIIFFSVFTQVHAQQDFDFSTGTFSGLVKYLVGFANMLVPLIMAVALVVFLWGVVKTMYHADDPKQRREGAMYLLYGIIAFTVISGLWGIVYFLGDLFGLSNAIPQLKP